MNFVDLFTIGALLFNFSGSISDNVYQYEGYFESSFYLENNLGYNSSGNAFVVSPSIDLYFDIQYNVDGDFRLYNFIYEFSIEVKEFDSNLTVLNSYIDSIEINPPFDFTNNSYNNELDFVAFEYYNYMGSNIRLITSYRQQEVQFDVFTNIIPMGSNYSGSSFSGSVGFSSLNLFDNIALFIGSSSVSYEKGYDDGYSFGYDEGLIDGVDTNGEAFVIFNGILNVAMIPINVFLKIFEFEVFGINISSLVSALLSVAILIIVIRLITGKKSE